MELQTLFEMEDIAVSEYEYHVVSSVPDFRAKHAKHALICRFKNGDGERIQLYHSSQSKYSTLHQIHVRYGIWFQSTFICFFS